jgi:hypothetical protein
MTTIEQRRLEFWHRIAPVVAMIGKPEELKRRIRANHNIPEIIARLEIDFPKPADPF